MRESRLPPYERTAEGDVGSFVAWLLDAWLEAGVGGTCARCGTTLESEWGFPKCPSCDRERQEAHGCKCGGSGVCPDCTARGYDPTAKYDEFKKCRPGCSALCPICSPDD